MKLRKLARLCEHDSLHAHYVATSKEPQPVCPGGVFLPDLTEALVWLEEIQDDYSTDEYGQPESFGKRRAIGAILDALSVREAEPEVDKNQMGMW